MANSNILNEHGEANFELESSSARNMLATPESPPESNSPHLKPKLPKSTRSTRRLKSLPISALVSTLSAKDLFPYWNARCQELQSTLWCPTEIECRELASSLSKPSSSDQEELSCHLIKRVTNPINSVQNCLLDLSPVSAIPTTDGDRPATREVSRKIRIYPKNQRKWFELLHASRRAYNCCIEKFRAYTPEQAKIKQAKFRANVRERVLLEFPDVPHVMLDEAVNVAYLTQHAVIKKRKQGLKCEYSYRSRKSNKQSFIVQRLSSNGPFPSVLNQHLTEAIPSVATGKMASVVWENGRWFLICKVEVAIAQTESQGEAIVACDPGVRTFITTFSPVDCAKIGKGFAAKLRPMLMQLDKLFGLRKKFLNVVPQEWKQCHRNRFRYFQKHIFSIRNKIQDLIHDLHKRAANFLTKNYDVILLPTFETSNMVMKTSRKISSRVVRQMLSLGHYRFKQFLSWIAYKRGKRVVACSEAYTSRTDSRTGEMVNVGASETINKFDRDVNSARGILLRALAT